MSKDSFIDFTIRIKVDGPSDFQKKKMDREVDLFASNCLSSTCWEYKTFSIFVDPLEKEE